MRQVIKIPDDSLDRPVSDSQFTESENSAINNAWYECLHYYLRG